MGKALSILMSIICALGVMSIDSTSYDLVSHDYAGSFDRDIAKPLTGDRGSNVTAQESGDVRTAAEAALEYVRSYGFKASAFKDALEKQLPDALCYSVQPGVYHVLYNGNYYALNVAENRVDSVSDVANVDQLPVYGTLDAAKEANADVEAFLTRGLSVEGDRGHALYRKSASLAEGQPGAVIAAVPYALSSAESAVNVFQLGYAASDDSVNAAIDAFHASGFHTLVFSKGEYRLTAEVWSRYDDRAYYGIDATLYTDSEITHDGKNTPQRALWMVRGNVVWGEGAQYTVENEDGTSATRRQDGYHTVRNIELAGLAIEMRDGSSGYHNLVALRNARNVTVNACNLKGGLPLELYGDYDTVNVTDSALIGSIEIRDLCNHVGNHPESVLLDDDNPDGARNVVVRNCLLTTTSSDEGLPIFAGNEQGLGNADGVEYPILKNCLVENVLIENNRFFMDEPPTEKKRVVAITCGYQDSPVKNVRVEHNDFDVYFENYLILFGYALDCSFSYNDVTVHSATSAPTLMPVFRSTHSRTGPTSHVAFGHNTLNFPEEKATVSRMVDYAFDGDAVSFTHNDVTVAGKVSRVFDSLVESSDNTFHLTEVKYLYDRVGEVARNTYTIAKLGGLYESYDTDARADLVIHDEQAAIDEFGGNLLTFNGAPSYNGHSISFSDCAYDIADASAQWRYVAYNTSAIIDTVTVSFDRCQIPGFETAPHNTVVRNDDNKVVLANADIQHLHDWGEWASIDVPTCTEAGSESRICAIDPTHVETRAVAALGHVDDGGKVTREATQTAEGEMVHSCERCGAVLSTEVIPKKASEENPSGNNADGEGDAGRTPDDDEGETPDSGVSGEVDDGGGDAPDAVGASNSEKHRIIEGDGAVWDATSNAAGLLIVSDADFSKFRGVLVDGVALDPSCYEAESGSTRVTLLARYLRTLPPGTHSAVIRSADGDASTVFTVRKASDSTTKASAAAKGSSATPATGDFMGAICIALLVAASLSACAALAALSARRP